MQFVKTAAGIFIENAEMLADVKAYDAARAGIEHGEDEVIPIEIIERRVAGESTIKIWREHPGAHPRGAGEGVQGIAWNDCRNRGF